MTNLPPIPSSLLLQLFRSLSLLRSYTATNTFTFSPTIFFIFFVFVFLFITHNSTSR
jgi:hypothetical protein